MDDATATQIRQHFDDLAHDEWQRLSASPAARVSLEIHRRFLARFVRPGDRVPAYGGPLSYVFEDATAAPAGGAARCRRGSGEAVGQ